MGNQNNTIRERKNEREFIEREMGRPFGKEILDIEEKIIKLKLEMESLLRKRYLIEEKERKEKEEKEEKEKEKEKENNKQIN